MVAATIGIDIGTHSTKGVLVAANGTVLSQASIQHDVSMPGPGRFEHDADEVWWGDTVRITRQLMAEADPTVDVAAVGISACGPCLVPIDSTGHPLRAGILYGVDTRAAAQIERLDEQIGRDTIIERCGMPLTSQSVGPKIEWLREAEPDIFDEAACFLTATGYVVYRLTDETRLDHHQAAYFAPYYSLHELRWEAGATAPTGLDRLLPPLAWSDEIVGTVTETAARDTGLPPGTPVVAGSSDGLNDIIGAGLLRAGDAVIRYGSTTAVVAVAVDAPRTDSLWVTPGAQCGQLNVAAALSSSGSVTSWFRREFARELPQGTAAEVSAAHSELIGEAAESPPGAHGLILLPYFAGERTPFYDPDARGVLLGLTLAHTRGDVYRAVLEGSAYGVRHILEKMRDGGVPISRLRAVGGGTASSLWMRIVSDVTGETQEIATPPIGAPLGVAFLAALACGAVADLADVESWVIVEETVQPDGVARAGYDVRYEVFRRLYTQTRDLLDLLHDSSDADAMEIVG